MSKESDEQLMLAVQTGALEKLNELCERYQKRIYNYCLKSVLDADDSADLTQNIFIRVLKYRKSYKPGSNFEFWLFQIARNQVKDHFRKMKVHRDQFQVADVLPDRADDSDEEQREREQRLMRALSLLPEEKRELLVLSKFEGMKYEQIAALKSTSVSAVKVQVHRTIKQLKELYFEIKS